jgi:hypothetical protein
VGHVARKGAKKFHTKLWYEKLRQHYCKDLGIDGGIILKRVLKQNFVIWAIFISLGTGSSVGVLVNIVVNLDRLCDLVVRVPGYRTEMYCASCEVRT